MCVLGEGHRDQQGQGKALGLGARVGRRVVDGLCRRTPPLGGGGGEGAQRMPGHTHTHARAMWRDTAAATTSEPSQTTPGSPVMSRRYARIPYSRLRQARVSYEVVVVGRVLGRTDRIQIVFVENV